MKKCFIALMLAFSAVSLYPAELPIHQGLYKENEDGSVTISKEGMVVLSLQFNRLIGLTEMALNERAKAINQLNNMMELERKAKAMCS